MNPEETIMEGHMHEPGGNHHGRSHARTRRKPSWKITCTNPEETIMEGHMQETITEGHMHQPGGDHHGWSHA